MSALAFALAGMLSVSAAATPATTLNDSFNYWLLEALQAAKAWAPDACLVEAYVRVRSGGLIMTQTGPDGRVIPGSGLHIAGGEFYDFFFYAPSVATSGYHYRSPLQVSGPGETSEDERETKKTLAPMLNSHKGASVRANLPHCIFGMPITLLEAYQTAFRANPVLGENESIEIELNDFGTAQLGDASDSAGSLDLLNPSLEGIGGRVWAFAVRGSDATLKSLAVIDAMRGTKIKRRLVQPKP